MTSYSSDHFSSSNLWTYTSARFGFGRVFVPLPFPRLPEPPCHVCHSRAAAVGRAREQYSPPANYLHKSCARPDGGLAHATRRRGHLPSARRRLLRVVPLPRLVQRRRYAGHTHSRFRCPPDCHHTLLQAERLGRHGAQRSACPPFLRTTWNVTLLLFMHPYEPCPKRPAHFLPQRA